MRNLWKKPRWLIGLAAAACFVTGAQGAETAYPGMVNYVEGQVSVNGSQITPHSVGSTDVGQQQVLETGNGKAEMLLTPGVFLRVGDNSAVRMLNPGLTDTRVQVLKGDALVEVTDLMPQNHLRVIDDDTTIDLLKNGVYGFNGTNPEVAVFDGKAAIEGSNVTLKKGKELALNAGQLKPQKFDVKKAEQQDDLYQWSSLRSEYLAEASWDSARTIVVGGYPWWGTGWYWNPYWDMYSFLPGDGFLYSPFGWGFYSPWAVWRAPIYGGYWGGRAAVPVQHGRFGAVPRGGVMPHRGAFVDRPMGSLAPNAGIRDFGGFHGGFGGGFGRMGGGPRR
jgi:hypothetical protein